ncbi:MAG TPA: hypothetical protein VHL05_15000 [Terriglobales bacterium]|nr:hypothetical protein [Terriglobales bacterium]
MSNPTTERIGTGSRDVKVPACVTSFHITIDGEVRMSYRSFVDLCAGYAPVRFAPEPRAEFREAAQEALQLLKTVQHAPPFSARIERCIALLKRALAWQPPTKVAERRVCGHLQTEFMHFLEPSAVGVRERRKCSDCGQEVTVQTSRQSLNGRDYSG